MVQAFKLFCSRGLQSVYIHLLSDHLSMTYFEFVLVVYCDICYVYR